MNPVPRITLTCEHCNRTFAKMACQLTRGRGRYCSRACTYAARNVRMTLTCERCGQSFERKRIEYVAEYKAYCSRACYEATRSEQLTGYKKVGAIHEHRLIAAQTLGRALLPGEVVHHDDNDRLNNSPDNLKVLPSQSEHARLHFTGTKQSAEHVRKRIEAQKRTMRARCA